MLVAIVLVIAFALLGDALRLTADDADGDVCRVVLRQRRGAPRRGWQAACGSTASAPSVVGADVKLVGEQIGVDDCPADCKSSYADFDFTVPEDVGDAVTLDISVGTRPGPDWKRFKRVVPLYGRGMSALRRVGKAVLALALLGVQALLLFALARRATRRQSRAERLLARAGGRAGLPRVRAAADRRDAAARAVRSMRSRWRRGRFGASWVATRLDRHVGLATFEAHLALVEMAAGTPFRGAAHVAPIRPVEDVENAWLAVGLAVRRAGADLIVTAPGGAFAVVPVPASASFGGEPLVFRASDPDLAELMVSAATNVLGGAAAWVSPREGWPGWMYCVAESALCQLGDGPGGVLRRVRLPGRSGPVVTAWSSRDPARSGRIRRRMDGRSCTCRPRSARWRPSSSDSSWSRCFRSHRR